MTPVRGGIVKRPSCRIVIVAVILAGLFLGSCSRRVYKSLYPVLNDGKYDTEFPYRNCSKELKTVAESVKKLICIANYKSYIFAYSMRVRVQDINESLLQKAKDSKFTFDSVSGTGTVIDVNDRDVAVLTCAHVFNRPDTMFSYYLTENNQKSDFIQSVSFKQKQSNYIPGLRNAGEMNILLMDKDNDIAIMGFHIDGNEPIGIHKIPYPFGSAKNLEWGSFVYMIGYPKGVELITKGIVSSPNRDDNGAFLLDALFNRGFSGGIILAIKDGAPNFEIVGIANSAYSDDENILVPAVDWRYDESIPYQGDIYVRFKHNINYGLSQAVPSESILRLIRLNRDELEKKGYDLSGILEENQQANQEPVLEKAPFEEKIRIGE
jgi:hypothetical protein